MLNLLKLISHIWEIVSWKQKTSFVVFKVGMYFGGIRWLFKEGLCYSRYNKPHKKSNKKRVEDIYHLRVFNTSQHNVPKHAGIKSRLLPLHSLPSRNIQRWFGRHPTSCYKLLSSEHNKESNTILQKTKHLSLTFKIKKAIGDICEKSTFFEVMGTSGSLFRNNKKKFVRRV